MERPGYMIPIANLFKGDLVDGEIDVDWFCMIKSEGAARARLEFMRTPKNIFALRKRGYGGEPLNRMWKAVFRGCIAHGVPIPSELNHLASELGVIVPPE